MMSYLVIGRALSAENGRLRPSLASAHTTRSNAKRQRQLHSRPSILDGHIRSMGHADIDRLLVVRRRLPYYLRVLLKPVLLQSLYSQHLSIIRVFILDAFL